MESDLQLMEWLRFHRRHCRVVVTKSDKWKNQSARHGGLAALAGRGDGGEPLLFSALTGQGVREIWKTIQTIGIRP
jgi:GTP-binding protein